MHTIGKSQIEFASDGRLSAEASTLGLKPTEWPLTISIVGTVQEIMFHREDRFIVDGKFGGYFYFSELRQRLQVFND